MTKKGAEHASHNCKLDWSAQVANGNFPRSTSATRVGHLLVCSTIFCRDFECAGDTSRLRLRPANLRWSHCSWCQVLSVAVNPTSAKMTLMDPCRRMSHCDCDSRRTIKRQQSDHLWPASIWEVRRSPSLDDVSLSTALLKSPVSTAAPDLKHMSRIKQQKRAAHRPLFSAFVVEVDVRDSNVARLVGCPEEPSGNRHAFNSPCLVTQRTWNKNRRTGDVVLEGILVEEHGAMMLDDHVEVLLQGTVVTKPDHSCTQIIAMGR